MLAEPVTIAGRNLAPGAQVRPVTKPEVPRSAQEEVKDRKERDLSQMGALVADVQKNLNMIHNVDLKFTVHKASGQTMVKVMDGSTGDLIREIPPSQILDLAARLDEMIGLIFDQKG